MNETVKAAILATPVDYFQKVLREHNPGPDALGSQFLEAQDLHSLSEAEWEQFDHPDIKAPAKGFRAPIAGKLGVLRLSKLPFDDKVLFLPSRKGTGYMDVAIERTVDLLPNVYYSVLLVGPGGDAPDAPQIVWAIFPGDPVPPSTVKVDEVLGGADALSKSITVADAIKMGFEYAKVQLIK